MRDLAASLWEQRNAQGAEGVTKTAVDLDRYRRVLASTRPTGIIECGTYSGASALWFARVGSCEVFTIDTSPHIVDHTTRREGHRAGVRFWPGSSVDLKTIDAACEWASGHPRLMVVLDSDHSAGHVLAELRAYGGLVTPGCYCVVEDGVVRWLPEQWPYYRGSPLDAIEVYLMEPNGAHFDVDDEMEDLHPTTQFPSGWLVRR